MADSPAVELKHVDAGYPGAVILRDVTFDVARGEIFALLGGSGCGKSTIMKHMIGLNPVLAGELRLAGMSWSRRTRAALSPTSTSMTCSRLSRRFLRAQARCPTKSLKA